MIIVAIFGGLGNQMFQYAVGRRLALSNNSQLKLDLSIFKNQIGMTPRTYKLDVFNIKAEIATSREVERLKGSTRNFLYRYWRKLKMRVIPYYRQSYILEKTHQFDPNILKLGSNVYLQGFWPSEKYFREIENFIRQEFTFKKAPTKQNRETAYRISKTSSVSIHFRRADYVTDKATHNYHGVCGLSYYRKAVDIISKKISKPHFYIFSDDPSWTKRHFHIKYPVFFVDNNPIEKGFEDLRLMSLCKHNIIANSSFSWWGAWLNRNPEKIVIAPKRWFRNRSKNTSDRIPDSWIKV
jgi:hypothetical protein